ncbi:MAG: GTPase Era [Clostridia bacterium]|nr:GTPase Era [Clostridia bacterium]
MFKSGFVAIVGRPNVGKSTLLNAIAGQKIAIVSNKPQTTRTAIKGIVNREDAQIIFTDTPGIHKPKNKLGEKMAETINDSMTDVDVILYLIEGTDKGIGLANEFILNKVIEQNTKAILVINKVDLVKKENLLELIKLYSERHNFEAIIPISARNLDGIDTVIDKIVELLPEGPAYYDTEEWTDQTERQIIEETIREKALRSLDDEVPHGIAVEVISMKKRDKKELYDIDATIYCEKKSHKGIIIGKDGAMLKKIGERAREDIEKMLDCKVNLQLWVKVKEDWRDNETRLNQIFRP